MYTGPNIINNGLVYGYDTGYGVADPGVSTRFYKGKPTTNLQVNGVATGHNSSGYGNVVTVADAPEKGPRWKKVTISNRGSNMRIIQWTYTTHDSNVIYSHSAEFDWGNMRDKGYSMPFDGAGGGTRVHYINRDYTTNGSTSINTARQDGHFASTIIKSGGSHVHSWFIYNSTTGVSGLNDYFYYRDYQVEKETEASPFISGTRSDTASLLDLKGTASIDVSNISFDSTSQPVFDGTDDILNTGLFSGRNPSTDVFTIEAIVKSDVTANARMWLDATGNGSNQRLYCAHASTGSNTPLGIQNSAWSHSTPQDTDYHHYVITMNGSTAQLYNNGVAHSSKSYTSYTLSGQINVGGRNSYYWDGDIPVFKIYNRVLTTTEITQNYNAYKQRFNI